MSNTQDEKPKLPWEELASGDLFEMLKAVDLGETALDDLARMSGYDYYLMNLLDRIERGDELSDQEQAAREALEKGREALERSQETLRKVDERLGDKK